MKSHIWVVCSATFLLCACASSGGTAADSSFAENPNSEASVGLGTSCSELLGFTVSSEKIGLPTNGAKINAATVVGGEDESVASSNYCLVSGAIAPIDSSASSINFALALPEDWNSKVVMLGGGGFNGVVPDVAGTFLNAPADARTPLERGYAVFGSDSGHQSEPNVFEGELNGDFFRNEEEYRNYIGDALKKTRDVALQVIGARYGAAPTKSYFLGGSKGGGEALQVAGRWPEDWDGVVSLYPARNYTVSMLGSFTISKAMSAPGAYLDLDDRDLLHRAALEACDAIDGLSDGLISDVRSCNARFKLSEATVEGRPLRCNGEEAPENDCLSDAQIAAVLSIDNPTHFGTPMGAGQTIFPGFNMLTADLGGHSESTLDQVTALLTIGISQPQYPLAPGNSAGARFTDSFFRNAVTRDSNFNQFSVDLSELGDLGPRLKALSEIDQVDLDLSAFMHRGGRLMIMHGTDDLLLSSRSTEKYIGDLRSTMGSAQVDQFLRYFEVPGFGHSQSTDFLAQWDQLSALEDWVERNIDPAQNQTVVDAANANARTRPLCLYPTWPKYIGSGDPDIASSFVCEETLN